MRNLVVSGMMPVENIGDMSTMYKSGSVYEVMVEDRMNPDCKFFSFGLNGRMGEYPTNAKIKLRGEEIQHLYNCTYESPVVEDSGDGGFRRVVGKRVVCRFAITPTQWGALPTEGTVLKPAGMPLRANKPKLPFFDEAQPAGKDVVEENSASLSGVSADDLLAAREKELEYMNISALRELAQDRGIKQNGSKASLIEALLKYEEELLTGEE